MCQCDNSFIPDSRLFSDFYQVKLHLESPGNQGNLLYFISKLAHQHISPLSTVILRLQEKIIAPILALN
jgi:hypothetical protein